MAFDNICNTGLVLGLGFSSTAVEITTSGSNPTVQKKSPPAVAAMSNFEPSLTLGLSGETNYLEDDRNQVVNKKVDSVKASDQGSGGGGGINLHRQDSGAASSFSNVSVKRERDYQVGSEDVETAAGERPELVNFGSSSRVISDEDDDGVNGRKKLRLTKAQSALLEESFKVHSTLNPKQKQELARDLKLRPRQVEVWFQNRRARTKLKQTEVDCEYLKKCCETLTDENRRLQKEVQELKALKLAKPFYMQLPAATLTMCPSCERVGGDANATAATTTTKSSFGSTLAPKSQFFNPFNSPSAAC